MKKLIEYGDVDNKKCAEYYIQEYKGMIGRIENNVKERK